MHLPKTLRGFILDYVFHAYAETNIETRSVYGSVDEYVQGVLWIIFLELTCWLGGELGLGSWGVESLCEGGVERGSLVSGLNCWNKLTLYG